jgi:dTDP-L-rhamnose 4-epimerase
MPLEVNRQERNQMGQRRYAAALVTGGAGFIGTRLVRAIEDICDEVVIFDNLHQQVHGASAVAPNLGQHCRFVKGDVRDAALMSTVVEDCRPDLVVHLAAETGTGQSYDQVAHHCDVNVTGTANLVEAVRRLPAAARRVVLASSRAVYGEGLYRTRGGALVVPPPRSTSSMRAGRFVPVDSDGIALEPLATPETAPPAPASIYASTKLMQEFILRQGFDGTSVEVAVLRLQNVYGAGQSVRNPYTGVLSIFSQKLQDGHDIEIFEDGMITRDFVHVSDVARAIKAAAMIDVVPETAVNVGSGAPATIEDVARLLLRLHGRLPGALSVTGNFRSGDVRHCVADIGLARATLGWSPQVGLTEGLTELVSWVVRGAPSEMAPND